jgi:hypothetical protein
VFDTFESEHVIGFGFEHPVAQPFFSSSALKTGCPYLLSAVLP